MPPNRPDRPNRQAGPAAWERLPDESCRDFSGFGCYLGLPPAKRSLNRAYRAWTGDESVTESPGYFTDWSRRFRWVSRCRAFDNRLAIVRAEGVAASALAAAGEWERRRQEACERAVRLGFKLLGKADVLASFPVVERVHEVDAEGRTVTHLRPANVRALLDASAIACRAYGLLRSALAEASPAADLPDFRADPRWAGFNPASCDNPVKLQSFLDAYGGRA